MIDFSALDKLSENPQKETSKTAKIDDFTQGTTNYIPESQNAEITQITPQIRALQQESDRNADVLAAFKKIQDSAMAAESLKAEILRDLKTGEAVETILLKAIKALALATRDDVFCSQASEDLIAIYGPGLGESAPLKMALQAARERLDKLTESEGQEYDPRIKAQIQAAIAAHKRVIENLEGKLDN